MGSRPPGRGFTLLELLVVMFIIGIVAAMATLSVGVATREKGTEKEIDRIADLLTLASEQAVLQGREYGVTFYAREYEFSTYDPTEARWAPLTESESGPFSGRQFPPDAVVDLEIEDRLVALADHKPERPVTPKKKDEDEEQRRKILGEKDGSAPQVFILSSGDITPFKLRLRPAIGSPGITLKVADNGSVEKVRDER